MNNLFFFKAKHLSKIVLIVLPLCVSSCYKFQEEISWNIKDQPTMLVVEGTITNEQKNQTIKLTLSNAYFSNTPPQAVSGSSVLINDGENRFDFHESMEESGVYLSNDSFAALPGKTYHLYISLKDNINNQKEYTASSAVTEGFDIDSIHCEIYKLPLSQQIFSYSVSEDTEKDTTILAVYYYGVKSQSSGHYFFAKIFRNSQPMFDDVKDYPFSNDTELNGAYTNLMAVTKNVAVNDTITFNLFSINKEYYKYIDAISKIDDSGSIFSQSGPPANAVGNVEGALGFFLVSYVSVKTSLAIDKQ
jgi:hypothetical protein